MYFLHAINSDRQTRLLNVLGQIAMILGHKKKPSWCHWNFSLTQNPSDCTMALRSTHPPTEMSTRGISWG